jgi:inhibitor of cysteine peptidase
MFKKLTLTMITILLTIFLGGCNNFDTPANPTSSTNDASSGDQESTISDAEQEEYYQMLPMLSGMVANLKLDSGADGTTQTLKVGEVMSISLESNPSTGYSWFAISTSTGILAQLGEPQYQPPSSSGTPMLGAAGTDTFFFQAVSAGMVTLTLEYKRAWEANIAPLTTFTITVIVP